MIEEDVIMKRSSVVLLALVSLMVFYFGYELVFIFPMLPPGAFWLNAFLIGFEILTATFSIYLYHSIFATLEWPALSYRSGKKPFVSIHIPVYNETMGVLKKTVDGIKTQDYPKDRYEIIIADDSTNMNFLRKLERFCKASGIKLVHRSHRRGYKAGALNEALKHSRGDAVAVLDADDVPESMFLTHAVSTLYSGRKIAFVQTRNTERNHNVNAVTGIGSMVRDLFFGAIMKSKDARKLSIFCGSGGVVRSKILKRMGGWPEDTVTEDIDLSTKIFSKGLYSKYINPAGCKGLLPVSFTGLCGQTFRWSYGTTRTFLLRWRETLRIPGVFRKMEHFLSLMTYFLGPAIIGIDIIMIIHLTYKIPIFHIYEIKTFWLFGAIFTLSSFFALLFVQVKDKNVSIKRIITYMLAIYGLSLNFTLGVASAIAGRRLAFFRTPRGARKKDYKKLALRYWPETLLGSVSIAAGLLNLLNPLYAAQAGWAILFGAGFLSAPYLAFRYG